MFTLSEGFFFLVGKCISKENRQKREHQHGGIFYQTVKLKFWITKKHRHHDGISNFNRLFQMKQINTKLVAWVHYDIA